MRSTQAEDPEKAATGRRPRRDNPARIEPLATLPLFHKLAGRRVILAGATDGVAWKAELLAAAARMSGSMLHAAARRWTGWRTAGERTSPAASISWPSWTPEVIRGAALAIADVATDGEAEAFACAARLAGVPVNVVDRPAVCDVQFGAVVNRSPLVIGISTDGAAPVFGQAVRVRIEAAIPASFKRWAQAAQAWRPLIRDLALPFRARRAFWERFTATALVRPTAHPRTRTGRTC